MGKFSSSLPCSSSSQPQTRDCNCLQFISLYLTGENETNSDFIPPTLLDRIYMIHQSYEEFKTDVGLKWGDYVRFCFILQGFKAKLTKIFVSNGVYSESRSPYMTHYITLAELFQSRKVCFEYLADSFKEEETENVFTWENLYASGVATLVNQIAAGSMDRKKKNNAEFNQKLHEFSQSVLLVYMKRLMNGVKGLDKAGNKALFQSAKSCYEEYERILDFMKMKGINEEMRTDELNDMLINLLDVCSQLLFCRKEKDYLLWQHQVIAALIKSTKNLKSSLQTIIWEISLIF